MKCVHCGEAILEGERADNLGSDFHQECMFRGVGGSIAHLRRRCSCYVKGSKEEDPPGLTTRQAAKLAYLFKGGRVLVIYAIHERPYDYPDGYVVSHWATGPGFRGPIRLGADYAPTLEAARELIPPGTCRLPRMPGDDPKIVESWL